MSAIMSFTSVICWRVASLSSGEWRVASSTSLVCSLSLVLAMAASSSRAASLRRSWSTGLFASAPPPSSSPDDVVTEANSSASDSLKWASATISDSSGYSSCLYLSEARESVMALGYLRREPPGQHIRSLLFFQCADSGSRGGGQIPLVLQRDLGQEIVRVGQALLDVADDGRGAGGTVGHLLALAAAAVSRRLRLGRLESLREEHAGEIQHLEGHGQVVLVLVLVFRVALLGALFELPGLAYASFDRSRLCFCARNFFLNKKASNAPLRRPSPQSSRLR
ncbi:hypothetical protein VTK73DRAFT_6479 [Phialemonium thermophilum]|uniref:Uncharacterized protein n=1 Tax=Phialemonium thermophilum TaxID=223376 RepID=A0ABR3V033_9PEZI